MHMDKEIAKERQARLGKAIRAERQRKCLTQIQLAAMIGSAQNYVSAVERGCCNLKYDRLWQIADALKVHPSDLID